MLVNRTYITENIVEILTAILLLSEAPVSLILNGPIDEPANCR